MITLQVKISVSPVPSGFGFEARELILSTDALLKREYGGSCVGIIEGGVMTIEARTVSKDEFASMMESFCQHFRGEQRKVDLLVVEAPAGSLSADECAAGARLNTDGKLTKTFLMKLPVGCFLASQDLSRFFEPLFAEPIESIETRAAQWERIRAAGVSQRACHVFPGQAHYAQWCQDARDYFRAKAR